MKEEILKFLKENIKNPKLYLLIFIMFIILVIVFPYIDANIFYYDRVEKRITILEDASKLNLDAIAKNNVLKDEYNSILNEISRQKNGSVGSMYITDDNADVKMKKFISGFIVFGLLSLIYFFQKDQNIKNKIAGIVVCLICGVICGAIARAMPTLITPNVNYIIVPVIIIVFLCFIFNAYLKNK